MARKKAPPGALLKRPLKRPYIAEWRAARNLSQETLAGRVEELLGTSFTATTLSRIENAKSPYSQRQLEALAEALRCAPADLIMRDPTKTDAPWSIWEKLEPAQRDQALSYLRFLSEQAADKKDDAAA
ncbi:MAG: hypothetical protein DI549_10900 [Ancylobacter novellus]|uniref:HTH cro/C1-type domain-containing protein n=1 Tax=Ancylobacter novellus TaxID=921 RepID=A0A2W5R219_ANCNO|nr:MAG: hypothetical protein DI549_10900 [Ancylobacter novellus]